MGLSTLLILLLASGAYAQSFNINNSTRNPVNVTCVSGCSGGGSSVSTFTLVNVATVTVQGTVSVSGSSGGGIIQVANVTGSTLTVGYQSGMSSVPVSVLNFPASQAVTGTFFQVTQPISGTVSVNNLYSGTTVQVVLSTVGVVNGGTTFNVASAQSGAWSVSPGTGTYPVSITNPVSVTGAIQLSSPTLAVSVPGAIQLSSPTIAVSVPTLTKGSQGSTGLSVQDLKDAGRVHVTYYVVASTVGATTVESALTFTKASATSATSNANNFLITNGKTYRIEHISIGTRANATATAQTTTFNLRVNTSATCNAASTPVIWSARSAAPAVASQWDRYTVDFPEGLEILGTTTLSICASVNSTFVTNAPTADMIISGYEY